MVPVLGSAELQRSVAARPLATLEPPGVWILLSRLRGTVTEEPGLVGCELRGGPGCASVVESAVESGDWPAHAAENAIATSSIVFPVAARFTAHLPSSIS
jgi:hypothetical protein